MVCTKRTKRIVKRRGKAGSDSDNEAMAAWRGDIGGMSIMAQHGMTAGRGDGSSRDKQAK